MTMLNGTDKVFEGYDVSYVKELLDIVGEDVQDNKQIGNGDYLDLTIEACKNFNEKFKGTFFSDGGMLSDKS